MREIKFRYYNAASKVMHPNVYYAIDLDGNFLMSMPLPEGVYPPKDRRFTITELHKGDALMQYTGLKDKNGVEIYEGDIVSSTDVLHRENIDVVEYTEGGYVYPMSSQKAWARFFNGKPEANYEVIGNVYENPELLK